ncbi:hypothetical protein ASE23_27075 [Rhizobium sp. Root73]|nr:hypothetical protein ASE23_27075 [Rhizobium sp. Root73]
MLSSGHGRVVFAIRAQDAQRSSSATLTGREEAGIGSSLDGNGQVGIIKHDHRVLAAHFQLELAVMFDGSSSDTLSRTDRTGKGYPLRAPHSNLP